MNYFWGGYTKDDWRDLRLEVTSAMLITFVALGVGYYLGNKNGLEVTTEAQKTLIDNCIGGESVASVQDNGVIIQCVSISPETP